LEPEYTHKSLEDSIRITGENAKFLLENPLFVSTFDSLKDQITEQTFSSAFPEGQKRHDLFCLRKALDTIENALLSSLKAWELQEAELGSLNSTSEDTLINED
jgi:hypothetical protein